MSDKIRTFIAIELPEKILTPIRQVQGHLRDYGFKIRWVPPTNIHLTLKFLGDIDASEIEKIGQTILKSVEAYEPLSLGAKGIGVFPGLKNPRVVWVGVFGMVDPLTKLHQSLQENLELVGFPKEKRRFKTHLTLGRIKSKVPRGRLLDAIQKYQGFQTEAFVADRITLFKSDLKPSGAIYTRLKHIPF